MICNSSTKFGVYIKLMMLTIYELMNISTIYNIASEVGPLEYVAHIAHVCLYHHQNLHGE